MNIISNHFLQSNYAICFLRLPCKNQRYLLLRSHCSQLRDHLNSIWPSGVFMLQICVSATGKQEVNMPLGILKSEFNWKNLSLERVFFSFTVCLIVNACCKYGKKQCSLFLPNYIIYFIRIEFSIFNAILVFFFST